MPRPRKDTEAPKGVLSTKAAAAAIGVTESRIRQAIRDGKLKSTLVGSGQHAIKRSDLEAYRRWAASQDNNGPKLPRGYLSTPQAAASLGVSEQRIRQLIDEGSLRAERFGRRWGIKPSALEAYRPKPAPAEHTPTLASA